MGVVSPSQSNAGDLITAAAINNPVNQLAAQINGNLDATNIADSSISTSKLANGGVTPAKLSLGAQAAYVAGDGVVTGTSYGDASDTTTLDQVTVSIGNNGVALITFSARSANTVANAFSYVTFQASGANTIAADDKYCFKFQGYAANAEDERSAIFLIPGLTAGSTTFKLKYKVASGGSGSGTAGFNKRHIAVVPL